MNHYTFHSLVAAHRAFFNDKTIVGKNDPVWSTDKSPGLSLLALCFHYTGLPKKREGVEEEPK